MTEGASPLLWRSDRRRSLRTAASSSHEWSARRAQRRARVWCEITDGHSTRERRRVDRTAPSVCSTARLQSCGRSWASTSYVVHAGAERRVCTRHTFQCWCWRLHGRGESRTLHGEGECIVALRIVLADLIRFLRSIEHVHGHPRMVGRRSVLVHPAVALRNRTRRAYYAVGLSTAFATVASGIGAWLYVAYRERSLARIFQTAPSMGFPSNAKSTVLGAGAGLGGRNAHRGSRDGGDGRDARITLRTIAFRSFAASAVLAVTVAVPNGRRRLQDVLTRSMAGDRCASGMPHGTWMLLWLWLSEEESANCEILEHQDATTCMSSEKRCRRPKASFTPRRLP